MNELIIAFNDKQKEEIQGSGVFMSVSWDALLPQISDFVRLRPDETIDGFLVNETDIRVKISKKKGRKSRVVKTDSQLEFITDN